MITRKDIAIRRIRHAISNATKIEALLALRADMTVMDREKLVRNLDPVELGEEEVRQEVFRFLYGEISTMLPAIFSELNDVNKFIGPGNAHITEMLHKRLTELSELLVMKDGVDRNKPLQSDSSV